MTLQEIIQANKDFKLEIDKLKCQIVNLEKERKDINSGINFNDIKTLTYEEAKEIKDELYWNLSEEQRKELSEIVKNLKESKYPILKMAHYYPMINEMDFLSDEQKVMLDKLLRRLFNSYIYIGNREFSNLKLSESQIDKVFEYLYAKGVVSKWFQIRCGCHFNCDEYRLISEKEYNDFVKSHNMDSKVINKMTEEEKESFFKDFNENYCIYIDCDHDGTEITSIDDLNEAINNTYYKNITKPDLTYENI